MKAYKVFDENLKCRNYQFEVGKIFKIDGELKICSNGFHACEKLNDCFNYYEFNQNNRICEVELIGNIVFDNNKEKCCTDKIKIIKELTWIDALNILNIGKNNTGRINSGNCNSGDSNSGNCNSGDSNSGNWNSGDSNSGYCNSGDSNSGDSNSGDSNSGDSNSGNRNSGDSNSGNRNSGKRNSGDSNSGNWNSGDSNSGKSNSGDNNSGNWNSGNWNSGDSNSGYCNTNNPDKIRIFNKFIDNIEIDFPSFFYFNLTKWISHDTATQEEKEMYKNEIETCGGFLKTLEYKEAFKLSYEKANKEDKGKVKKLPNFDKDLFFEISGIMIED